MIQRRALKKWAFIVILCGAHSFYEGVAAVSADPWAMSLGLATLILLYAAIDSQPFFTRHRAEKSVFSAALSWGIRIRIGLAIYIPVSIAFALPLGLGVFHNLPTILLSPYLGEILAGMLAVSASTALTGIPLKQLHMGGAQDAGLVQVSAVEHFIVTYTTTIITGLIHTVALVLICVLAYGIISVRRRLAGVAVSGNASS